MAQNTLIFVYGTLKRVHRNHVVLERRDAKYVSEASVNDYALYDVGIPVAIAHAGAQIKGELYIIATKHLKHLDIFESGYDRIRVQVVTRPANDLCFAEMYVFNFVTEKQRVKNDCY